MTLKSQSPYYVIGHKNPDTDAICAAIGYAAYLRDAEGMDAVPLRCGTIPERVKWVLEQAKEPEPLLITDVRTTAGLICEDEYPTVKETDTFLTVYNAMQASGQESLPVISEAGEVMGIMDFTMLMHLLMPQDVMGGKTAKQIIVSGSKVVETLKGKSIGAEVSDIEETLTMFVGASSYAKISKSLQRYSDEGILANHLVICGDRPQLIKAAIEGGVRMLILTGECDVDEELIQKAKQENVIIICCNYDTATTVQLVRCSRVVSSALTGEFICIEEHEAVSELKDKLSAMKQEFFPVVASDSRKFVGTFTKAELVNPPKTKLVLVDHNEYSQAVNGVEEADVKIVVDHHRLGGNIVSREPIFFLNEPVGSSSTLVARKYRDNDTPISQGIAKCLCAGLISDTLNLTSPTTTETDKKILQWLCEKAGIQAEQFTKDFFASGSLLLNGSYQELVHTDRKEFSEGGKTVSISQVEEIGLDSLPERVNGLREELKALITNKGYDLAIIAVTDIAELTSIIIAEGDPRIIDQFKYTQQSDNTLLAQGVVSRKKQIFPAVCDAIYAASGTVIS